MLWYSDSESDLIRESSQLIRFVSDKSTIKTSNTETFSEFVQRKISRWNIRLCCCQSTNHWIKSKIHLRRNENEWFSTGRIWLVDDFKLVIATLRRWVFGKQIDRREFDIDSKLSEYLKKCFWWRRSTEYQTKILRIEQFELWSSMFLSYDSIKISTIVFFSSSMHSSNILMRRKSSKIFSFQDKNDETRFEEEERLNLTIDDKE